MTAPETQSKIVTTLKGGAGFDAPWIVVHSDTVAEAVNTLQGEEMKQLIEAVKSTAAGFTTGGGAPAPKRPQGQPAAATQAPGGKTPPPGYEFKSGVSKAGKPWKAFMPIDRNSGLQAIWL